MTTNAKKPANQPGPGQKSKAAAEPAGEVGTVCIYQASSPEAIRKHARAAFLPVDEIIQVADTVIVRPDPVPEATV